MMSDAARCSINGTDHPWCFDPSRDEAVRAAEDNRPGPLPTLEECIARQTARPCGGTDPAPLGGEPGGAVNGLRTERVTLEVTHHCRFPLKEWLLDMVADCTSDPGESVRVVDESAPAASGAAVTEVVSSEVVGYAVKQGKFYSQHLHANYGDAWGVAGKGTVVPLYATPPAASGWLTAEEREAIEWAADAAYDKQHPAEDTLRALLARSTPPEVVAPASYAVEHPQPPRDLEWRKALAAAGVTVKEVK